MKSSDYEIFGFSENKYEPYGTYWLNKRTYLDIVLTDRCNANCSFCIADLIHKKLDCDVDIFKKKILYAIDHLNVKEVLLLGGEPTMSLALLPILDFLNELKHDGKLDKIVMTTNGLRLAHCDDFCRDVMRSGLTHLNISFMSIDFDNQQHITHVREALRPSYISDIYGTAAMNGVKVRINTNVFKGNNETLGDCLRFYDTVKHSCDSVKFSPLLPTDAFSVLDKTTAWVKENRLNDDHIYTLFTQINNMFKSSNIAIIENDLQFGFVKNTMVPLTVPIILNWNFGEYTGMMKHVTDKKQINNIKLLPNNELSLSWNREASEWFVYTE